MAANPVDPAYPPGGAAPPPAPAYPDPINPPTQPPPAYSQQPPQGSQPQNPQQPPGYPAPGYPAPGYPAPPPQQQGPPPPYPQAYPSQNYGPPHSGMAQSMQQQSTVIITAGPQQPHRFGEAPKVMNCPHCRADITTSTEYKMGSAVWVAVGIILLVGLFLFPFVLLGCCFIPMCIPSLKDVEHSCPNCHHVLGHFHRST